MNKLPWFKFFPADWLKGTRAFTHLQKALWVDLLCFMWESHSQGEVSYGWDNLCRLLNLERLVVENEIMALSRMGIFDVFCLSCKLPYLCNGGCNAQCNAGVTLVSRRMKRECNARENDRRRQERRRESTRLRVIRHRKKICPGSVQRLSRQEVRSQKTTTTTPVVPFGDESFENFWRLYPRKVGKAAAAKAWKKISSVEALFPKIQGAVSAQSKTEQWLKEGGQFIPHPATWLNQGRWEDEVGTQGKEARHWSEIPISKA